MLDRLFTAVLAFVVLAAGTLAVGFAMLEEPQQMVQLPKVEVTGKRPMSIAQVEASQQSQP